MTSEEAVLAVIDALEETSIPYMVVGSFSTNYYGVARLTNDADFVIQAEAGAISALASRLGPGFRLDPQMAFELVTGTTKHVVQLTDTPFIIELFHLSDDSHDQERFRRRRRVKLLGRESYLPTVEDVIVTKVRWFAQGERDKDSGDVRNVIAIQGGRIDWDYVCSWCDQHGTREALDEIRRSVPPADPT